MVPLGAEHLFTFLGVSITNTVVATLLTDIVILSLVFTIYKTLRLYPGKLQSGVESVIEYFYSLTETVAGPRTVSIFPWFTSFFLFIVIANLLALLPGYGLFGLVGHEEGHVGLIPLLRSPSSDMNMTFALAVVSVVATHALSIKYVGFKNYLKKFFSLSPILLFVGVLELISEFTKLISFTFRLFGNIFAGEVVLGKISTLAAFFVPIPFVLLELIVAVVQALVFAMLTMAFMSILTSDSTH